MLKRSDGYPAGRLVTVLGVVWGLAVGLAAAGSRSAVPNTTQTPAAAPALASSPALAAQATGFVGDDTCTTCHEPQGKALHATLHGKAQNTRTPAAKANQSCESCHGPGQAHVDSGDKTKIKRFTALSPKDINTTCLTCHTRSSHADSRRS